MGTLILFEHRKETGNKPEFTAGVGITTISIDRWIAKTFCGDRLKILALSNYTGVQNLNNNVKIKQITMKLQKKKSGDEYSEHVSQ
ncbi:hypothetical protein TNCV_2098451 [Trichonephila clavipes]|nr:hypothetical protein TNCV_2098451 [Trichonephila clavipes]